MLKKKREKKKSYKKKEKGSTDKTFGSKDQDLHFKFRIGQAQTGMQDQDLHLFRIGQALMEIEDQISTLDQESDKH